MASAFSRRHECLALFTYKVQNTQAAQINFDIGTVPAASWNTTVDPITGPHLVHPRSTVACISSGHETIDIIYNDINVEALVTHVLINLITSVPLPEVDTLVVT
eukprot:XP_001705734.1 Hypothetical protein GL50803_33833 [Giardia lamblia ATCC 50803]